MLAVMLVWLLTTPAAAAGLAAPEVPESGREIMPGDTDSFSEGLLELGETAVGLLRKELEGAGGICVRILAWILFLTVLPILSQKIQPVTSLAGAVSMTSVMLSHTNSMIRYASTTLIEICEYGKLLCPVMTTALAAQGGITTSSLLYGGTTAFIALLSIGHV